MKQKQSLWWLGGVVLVLGGGGQLVTSLLAGPGEQPTGEMITFQGFLKQDGLPANGQYDFYFRYFDAMVGGNQIGPTIEFDGDPGDYPPIEVREGFFTVLLQQPFISERPVFPTTALEPQGLQRGGESVSTFPRIEITPAPRAIEANVADDLRMPFRNNGCVAKPDVLMTLDALGCDGRVLEITGANDNSLGAVRIRNAGDGPALRIAADSEEFPVPVFVQPPYGALEIATNGNRPALRIRGASNSPIAAIDVYNGSGGPALRAEGAVATPDAAVRITNSDNGSGLQATTQCDDPEAGVKVFNSGTGYGIFAQSANDTSVRGIRVDARRGPNPPQSYLVVRAPEDEGFAATGGDTFAAVAGPGDAAAGASPGLAVGWVTEGSDIGLWGYSHKDTGIRGQSPTGTGVLGTTDALVVGDVTAGVSDGHIHGPIGVHGVSANGYAGRFDGNVQINGQLFISGNKAFRIDHPLDPTRKYLTHYCTEGPKPLNIYNGSVELDEEGKAWVELPPYFEALNRDFHYQLTCIGGFAPVYIAERVQSNRFQIAGGRAGLTVSWTVTGVRNDRLTQENGTPVETDKPATVAQREGEHANVE